MNRFMTLLGWAADVLATAAFIGFTGAILSQVGYRYLGVSIIFSEELARLLNLYAVFLGAAVATRVDGHIRIDVIDRFISSGRAAMVFRILYLLAALVFLLILCAGSWIMVKENWEIKLATMDWLSNGHIYLAPAVGSVLMILLTIGRIAEEVRGSKP